MARTTVVRDNALNKIMVEEKLFREAVVDSYFSKFMGKGPENIIQEKTNLEKGSGDKITFGLIKKLTGAGITGTSGLPLEGNEEKLETSSFSLYLEEYAHAVRDAGPLDRQRASWDLDEESKTALKNWAAEKIDQLAFDALQASPTKIFYGGDATTIGSLEAGDKITPALISRIKAWARTGGARSQNPLRPIKINGKEHYIFLTHPDALYDLKQDTTFAQAMREAEVRGKENPLFKDAVAVWDGVIFHDHERVFIAKDGGAGAIPYVKSIFLGAQALVWAWGKRGEIVPETFDYGRSHGYGYDLICKTEKPVFDAKDYGSISVVLARTSISDA